MTGVDGPPPALNPSGSTIEEVIRFTRGNQRFQRMLAVAVGLVEMSDSMEITLLSYLTPCLAAEWDLSDAEQGTLAGSVFLGELVGALALGVMSDLYGRKPAFFLATVLVVVFGLLTAVAPSFVWIVLCRAMVGVGAGGMEVPFDLLTEFVEAHERGWYLLITQCTWALGSIYMTGVAWLILGAGYSWRWLALAAAAPPALVFFCFYFVPESPRWLLANGKRKEAGEVLEKAAYWNGVAVSAGGGAAGAGDSVVVWGAPTFRLRHYQLSVKEGHIEELVRSRSLRRISLTLWWLWMTYAFVYYGGVLLIGSLFTDSDSSVCDFLYGRLFLVSFGEILSVAPSLYYVERGGRRDILAILFLAAGVFFVLLPVDLGYAWLVLFGMLGRGAAFAMANMTWIVTVELYPTEIRSTGHAVCNALARVAAVGASYFADSGASTAAMAWTFLGLCALAAAGAKTIPVDTRGKALDEGHETSPEGAPLLTTGMAPDNGHGGYQDGAGTEDFYAYGTGDAGGGGGFGGAGRPVSSRRRNI